MRIEKIGIYQIARPLMGEYNTAFGDNSSIESIITRVESDGLVGWAESTPLALPFFSGEWVGGAFSLGQNWIGPRLLGCEIGSGEELQERLSPVKANYFAKAAFDLAWWDLKAQQESVPLWKLLGGSEGIADVGAALSVLDTPKQLLEEIEILLEQGFPRVKLKIKHGWDVEVIRLVRKTFPDAVFHVDANSGYTLEEADIFRALDEFDLAMIEQPLAHDDLLDHAKLQRMIQTPICLDESITSATRAAQAIEIGACGLINIKPGRVGGVTNSLEILRVARDAGILCWIGGMFESAIGASYCTALATLPGMGYSADIQTTTRFFERDLTADNVELYASGKIAAFAGPGIGCTPDLPHLHEVTVQSCELAV